jgi:hypothetical protein
VIVAALTDSIVSGLIGAAASFGAVFLAFWLPQRRRREERIHNLRIQGAQVTEPVRNLLLDAEHLAADDVDGAEALWRRWRDNLRDPLVAFGMAQGSAKISELTLRLRDEVSDLLTIAREAASNGSRLRREDVEAVVARVRELREAIGVDPDIRTRPALRRRSLPPGW